MPSTTDDLSGIAQAQNTYLEKQYSTQQSKYLYKTQQIQSLNTFIYYLVWVYFIFAVMYLILVFLEKKYSYGWKFFLLFFILVYPYVIYGIEVFFIKVYTFLVETIIGQVFKRPDNEFGIDYTFMPLQYVPNIFKPKT